MCCEHEPLPLRVSDFGEEPLFELWVWPLTAARSEINLDYFPGYSYCTQLSQYDPSVDTLEVRLSIQGTMSVERHRR